MNKKEILKILKKYNLDKKEYLVISGAAMVLLGIKEQTSDIDIAVTPSYYNYLHENYNCIFERINEYGNKIYFIDGIINFGISYYNKKNILINDLPVQLPEDILKLKLSLNRKKDDNDIKLIKEYMNE